MQNEIDNMKKNVVLKSTIWYLICNFIVSGINFIVTPVFTRLMSQEEYGMYSNFSSWVSIFQIVASLMLLSSFYSAKYDFKDEISAYISSMLYLGMFFQVILLLLTVLFQKWFVAVTMISASYLPLLFFYLLFYPATGFFQLEQRLNYEYKKSVFISLLTVISTVGCSVILVLNREDKLWGRIAGSKVPVILINAALIFYFLRRSPKLETKYWGYALKISVPFVIHSLGMTILSSSDRIMITSICGAKENSLYSLAYSCAAVMNMLISAITAAVDPWLLEKFNQQDESAKGTTKLISVFILFCCTGAMLIAPELLLIMGGAKYQAAITVMPPVLLGTFFQYLYGIYANVEQFSKKTGGMAVATGAAAILNLTLNYIFIPIFGYSAAGYTTLVCYIVLSVIHYGITQRIGGGFLFDNRINFIIGLLGVAVVILMEIVYRHSFARIAMIGIYGIFLCAAVFRYRKLLLEYCGTILKRN